MPFPGMYKHQRMTSEVVTYVTVEPCFVTFSQTSDLDKAVECLVPAIFFRKVPGTRSVRYLRAKRASCALREGGGAERRRVSCGRGIDVDLYFVLLLNAKISVRNFG